VTIIIIINIEYSQCLYAFNFAYYYYLWCIDVVEQQERASSC